jgi:hypothetical protein
MRWLVARGAACIAAVLGAGCYTYRPLAGTLPSSGTAIRVQLTDSGSVALRNVLGQGVVMVTGRFRGRDERGLMLAVESTESRTGELHEWQGEVMAIPVLLVATTEERAFAPWRTALTAGGIVAASVGAVGGLRQAGGGGGTGRTPPTPH